MKPPPLLSEKGFLYLVWHGCLWGGQRIAHLLLVFCSQKCRKCWQLWDPCVCQKSSSLQHVFVLLPGARLILTPHLAKDAPKDTAESIICNTTVIIHFWALDYVFMRFGVEDFFSSVVELFSLRTKADLQCGNNDFLRVQLCPCCSHWQNSLPISALILKYSGLLSIFEDQEFYQLSDLRQKWPKEPLGRAALAVQLKRDTKAWHSALSCLLVQK